MNGLGNLQLIFEVYNILLQAPLLRLQIPAGGTDASTASHSGDALARDQRMVGLLRMGAIPNSKDEDEGLRRFII